MDKSFKIVKTLGRNRDGIMNIISSMYTLSALKEKL